MLPESDHSASPAELARMLAVQAEMLALNAAIESARGGGHGAQLRALAEEAWQLARRGKETAERHERLALAESAAGQILDQGLAVAPIELEPADDLERFTHQSAGRMIALAERAERAPLIAH